MAKNARKLAKRSVNAFRSVLKRGNGLKADHAVLIEWEDHASIRCGWVARKELRSTIKPPIMVSTVGFPVYLDKTCVGLAQTFCDGEVGDIMKILLNEIKAVRKLTGKKE